MEYVNADTDTSFRDERRCVAITHRGTRCERHGTLVAGLVCLCDRHAADLDRLQTQTLGLRALEYVAEEVAILEAERDVVRSWLDKRRPLTQKQRAEFVQRHNGMCAYCGGLGDEVSGPDGHPWHIDHVLPITLGGSNHDSNLALACATCNLAKRAKHPDDFTATPTASPCS